VRFPSIAEMAISTNVHGGTYIYPNLNLKAESGWSYEMAYHLNEEINNLKFDVDIAYFMMQYNNMMEFSFAQWGSEYDLAHAYGLGFKTVNIGKTQIDGIETELNANLKINQNWKSNLSIGYTYMRPISLTPDSVYAQTNHFGIIEPITFNNSSSDTIILKYRYQHILKINAGLQYKNIHSSVRFQYNDYMRNIDNIFTSQLVNNGVSEADFPAIIPGINDSRENNKNGDIVIDLNIGITINKFSKINFIINNATNAEIITRPTDMQSPRTYSIKLKLNI
jgi:outer membrane receptor protein involved in Fe transport